MKNKSLFFILLLALFAPWAANAQKALPYSYGFENNDLTSEGWTKQATSSSTGIYNSSSASHDGSYLFRFYYGENPAYLVSPLLTGTTTGVDVVFYYANYSNSYKEKFQVGYTTDESVTDPSAFTYGEEITCQTLAPTYSTYENTFPAQTKRIAIKYIYTNGYYLYLDDFSFTASSGCAKPTGLAATLTQGNGTIATLSWTENGEATSWILQYGTDNTFATGTYSQETVNNTPSMDLTGLTAEQTYYARVKPSCDTDGTKWSNVCEFKPTNAYYKTVYDGTTTNAYIPVYGYWCDATQRSEFIIPSTALTDIGGATINSMKFYANYNYSGNGTFQVYVREVNESSFSNTTYYTAEGATTVYNGKLTISSTDGMIIEFNEDYEYEGGNLLVGFYQATGANAASSGSSFYGQTVSGASISHYSSNSASQKNFIPKTTFGYLPNATPKPRNLIVSSVSSSGATLTWEAPASATPTDYELEWKTASESWSDNWTSSQGGLGVDITGLSASTDYVVRVRAIYAEDHSDPIEAEFRTLDACAFPTNLVATTTPGQGTKATLSWVKGYDETAWVLELASDENFNTITNTITTGFVVDGSTVTYNATGLTAETHYYARVMANCDGPTSAPSNVVEFTPTNYVDYTYNQDATSSSAYGYVPFYGSYVAYATHGRFIIPASSLADVAGGTVRKLSFYSSTTTANWGNATFKVYVAEDDNATFSDSPSTSTPFDWSEMTQVYSGSLSLANGVMEIVLDDSFVYSGTKNLMIGFEETSTGTNASASWYYKTVSNSCAYAYKSSSTATIFTTGRTGYSPKVTFNYQPTPYVKIAAINEGTIAATSAELTWTAPETTATITGYAYQYKLSSAAEWPTAWRNLAASATSVTLEPLTPGTSYDFQIKVLYGEHESAVNSTSFFTECAVVTDFPWSEKFESYSAGDFNHPCWVNEHISGDGTNIFKVYTSANGSNTTHQLQLPDQAIGTLTKLRLPEMNLPGNNYQFVIDVYRNNSTYNDNYPYEGIRIFASTDGNIEGATELTFIPRQYNVSSTLIPEESEVGWYTYEIPIGVSGTCYIILRGESQFCTSTYMDNLTVEQIPTCARPSELASSNVTNHSATIEWTAGDAEQTLWQIAYSKTSFDPNTASFDITTVQTVDFTTGATCTYRMDKLFDAESTYYLYIRANCGTATEPDYGPWSRKGVSLITKAATPAPSNFTASNFGSQTVDLVWNPGGGDYELSWDLYYVQSDDAPTAPTEETPATKTVTTLPTTENPYTLDGLTEESKYYIWVRANHTINSVTTHSAWVALTGNFFTTIAPCSAQDPDVINITHHNATVNWTGESADGFTVYYRTAEQIDGISEDFSSTPENWTQLSGALNDDGTGPTSTGSGWSFGTNNFTNRHAYMNIYSTWKYWLVTPSIEIGNNYVLNFDAAYTKYNSTSAPDQNGTDDRFVVLISTDNKAHWTSLREWNNAGTGDAVLNDLPVTFQPVSTIDLSAYSGQTVYIAFYGASTTSNTDNHLRIDNVTIGVPMAAGTWQTETAASDATSADLSNLDAGLDYEVFVSPNCDNTIKSDTITFTTVSDNKKYFITAGNWCEDANWMDGEIPALTDDVIIRANDTIESGCEAYANKITFENSAKLTIADGGQLITNTAVTATVQKVINAHGTTTADGGWYFIASPINSSNLSPTSAGLITDNLTTVTPETATYDLYRFNQNPSIVDGIGKEWMNYRKNTFSLANGKGYLYASLGGTTLNFSGSIKPCTSNVDVNLDYTENVELAGWNLVGNPFTFNAYVNKPFYKMNEDGSDIEPVVGYDEYSPTTIAPCMGILVQATGTEQKVTFSKNAPSGAAPSNGNLNIALTQANVRNNSIMDKAIISFNEGNDLSKFYFGQSNAYIYIPQDNKKFAIVSSEGEGEMPLNFRANENGTYTLNFGSQNVSFSYLHLIDNLTGNDIDLLQTPSYTFNATTTDYSSRFKLVFCTGINNDSDSFAFFSNGNWIIGNEGEATLQVIDVTGRILSSETVNGSVSKAINAAPGVYMIRLINGDNVKVQKIVVR